MVEKVLEMLEIDGLADIGKAINALIPVVSETFLQIVSTYLEEMDTALCDGAKALRRRDGIVSTAQQFSGSSIRRWLNGAFLQEAFTDGEADALRRLNPEPVSLLSQQQVETLLPVQWRNGEATSFALSRNVFLNPDNGLSTWWTSTPDRSKSGYVMVYNTHGVFSGIIADRDTTGVRPAIRVPLDALP